MTPTEVEYMLKPLSIKEFRIQLRARGLSPAGSLESLRDRLKEVMLETKDYALKNEDGSDCVTVNISAGAATSDLTDGCLKNNYARGGGQNVGNFITDRNSSRVLAPPGGGSQISFGDHTMLGATNAPKGASAGGPQVSSCKSIADIGSTAGVTAYGNNYSRPSGQQNVGNFMTDRASSRVLAPPGGSSQIHFG